MNNIEMERFLWMALAAFAFVSGLAAGLKDTGALDQRLVAISQAEMWGTTNGGSLEVIDKDNCHTVQTDTTFKLYCK